jgi:hypothetical protein
MGAVKTPAQERSAAPSWWTPADEAEFSAIVWALVSGLLEHKPRCRACRENRFCAGSEEAVQIVVDWRRGRSLLSRAQHLRRSEDAA